ncbi:NADH-quinone oxidoreductase subunit K [Acetobacterium sp.]|uniref:NADH-quinone oxidoreductase subunit K n=1 Tax=Acetobacterium sp. TaxID=1872094 RepID=UPI002F40AC85
MSNYLDALSVLILTSAFILMGNKRIKSYINTFRFQSILIALLTGIMGIDNFYKEGNIDILVVCLVVIAVKVIYIPFLLNKTYEKVEYKVEKDFFLNIPILIVGCCFIVVFSYFSISTTTGINSGTINTQVVNSISLILIGLFFMISRKKAIGQIIGFLVIENGIFVTALFATQGMPFIVDIGILIDILVAVIIMGIMVFRIDETFGSTDTNKIRDLRG